MITFNEQHLNECFTITVEFLGIVFNHHTLCCQHGAGGHLAIIDIDRTQLATTVWFELRIVAEMQDIDPSCQSSIHDGLTISEWNTLPINGNNFTQGRCAHESSLPVTLRAVSNAASRSKSGSNSKSFSLC